MSRETVVSCVVKGPPVLVWWTLIRWNKTHERFQSRHGAAEAASLDG
jgi:hypothetical protein